MNFKNLYLAAALALPLSVYAEREQTAVLLVNDDSGLVVNPETFEQMRMPLLAQIKDLRTKRKFARAKLEVISTVRARTVFVGTISDLKGSRAQEVLDATKNNPKHCNNLRDTFKAVRARLLQLEQLGYDSIYVYAFSSLIDAPSPCNNVRLKLPQLPVTVSFLNIFGSTRAVKAVALYHISPHQAPLYLEAMQGFADWARANDVAFAIFDEAASVHEIKNVGLWGIAK